MISKISHIISKVPSISLSELSSVDFDSRIDTKFLLGQNQLFHFLNEVSSSLVVLEVAGNRIFDYENIYCDTSEFEFFKKHHSGFGNRSKVRIRKYSDAGPFFFEVKNKTNKGKTVKYRVALKEFRNFQNPETEKVLASKTGFSFSELSYQTEIEYRRITLANKELTEKLTIDFEMSTSNTTNGFEFKNMVIVEVKQMSFSSRSPFIRALKDLKIYNTSFSKYCSSIAMLNTNVKKNRFLPIINNIKKIVNV